MPIRFTPVPLKARHDGWTADRQRRFIDVLAATKSLTKACAAVGMSRTSAYALRDRTDALHFRLAWRAALEAGFARDRRSKVDEVQEVEGLPNSISPRQLRQLGKLCKLTSPCCAPRIKG